MTAPGLTRVYAVHGKLAHLLRPGDVPVSGDAFCRIAPAGFGWRGTGSQLEYEIAAALPPCSRCESLSAESTDVPARFTEGVSARAPEIPGAGHHHPPAPGTVPAVTATPPLAVTAAKPAEPGSPSGEAESAHGGIVPRDPGPGALAGLPSPPSTTEGRPAPGPAGEGRIGGASPAAGLPGADARAKWKAALAGNAHAARNRRGKPRAKPGYQPGGNRRQPE